MVLEYIPVISDPGRPDDLGHDLAWWRDGGYYRYPWALLSPMTSWKQDVRKQFGIPNGIQVFFDSGGFMLYTGEFPGLPKLDDPMIGHPGYGDEGTAIDLIRWYNENARRHDPCMILDSPVAKRIPGEGDGDRTEVSAFAGLRFATDEEYERALTKTSRVARRMLDGRQGDYDLFGVIHGRPDEPANNVYRSLRDYDQWFNRLNRLGEFDGFAIAPQADPKRLVAGAVLAHHYFPKKPVHFLGQGGTRSIVLAAYLARYHGARVTVDSSTAIRYARRTVYLIPGSLRGTQLLTVHPETKEPFPPMPSMPCDCPVCEWNSPEALRGGAGGGANVVALLTLHNLYCINRFVRQANGVSADRETLLAYAPKETRDLFDTFDYYRENGYDKYLKLEQSVGRHFTKAIAGQRTLETTGVENVCNVCLKRGVELESVPVADAAEPLRLCADCAPKARAL